jgi:hypothetical protein
MMGRWGRRSKQLPYDPREKSGYWKLKEEILNHSLWRTRFGGYGPVIWQTTDDDYDDDDDDDDDDEGTRMGNIYIYFKLTWRKH